MVDEETISISTPIHLYMEGIVLSKQIPVFQGCQIDLQDSVESSIMFESVGQSVLDIQKREHLNLITSYLTEQT